jgi:hypothetical protein
MVDTLSGVFRPLVPAAFRQPILDTIKGLAHPGIQATRRPHHEPVRVAMHLTQRCCDCQQYQRAKGTTQPAELPQAIVNPTERYSHLHINLVGPIPQSSSGHSHFLTVVDHSIHWVEAVPLRSMTTALVEGWVSRFGVPQQINSKKGSQFTSLVWVVFTRWLGIKMQLTTPYLP